jgi:putative CocE/NonD family hydrolase
VILSFLAGLCVAPLARAAHAPWPSPNDGKPKQAPPPIYPVVKKVQAFIPMKDGVRLAVNLFVPDGASASEKFPAILSYLPYRKDDWSLYGDWQQMGYFVRRGYVGARVDVRGTGASEGNPPDREYSDQELEDGLEVIDWLSKQPWSSGTVGMFGISWGGFNSIQLARLNPPALKAIIAVCATEELFHDDIHYIDNLAHADEFELGMDLMLGLTRAPDFPVDERSLAARFDADPWFPIYLKHQRDGEFWRRASLAPDRYGEYKVPTFMIGGFIDGYRDSIPRFLENVKAPVKALLGPWNHSWPQDADPGPSVEWRGDAVRWWDYWLKGKQNGVMGGPRFEVYMRHWYPPDANLATVPGDWRAENGFPAANTSIETLYLGGSHKLTNAASPAANAPATDQLTYVPSTGIEAGFWWGDFTADQRPIDAFSLTYDSEPLASDTAILGWPKVHLNVSASAPLADWFARLSDVAPDGSVTLITGAGQSGAQRESAKNPADLKPGEEYALPIELHVTSWVFPKGHRIRVAISNALWPMIWPTPYSMTTSLRLGGADPSRLDLPVVPVEPPARPSFDAIASETIPATEVEWSGETWPPQTWTVTHDLLTGTTHVFWAGDDQGTFTYGVMKDHEQMSYEITDRNPAASSIHGEAFTSVDMPNRALVWSVVLNLKSDEKNFYYHFERKLTENSRVIREKQWDETIPRDHQ